ncbi:hypothetical protein P3646_24685, partial [Vibrio parahaemolyticus]|nr:hypothetical protein [Vibrio parahaemolyticus]
AEDNDRCALSLSEREELTLLTFWFKRLVIMANLFCIHFTKTIINSFPLSQQYSLPISINENYYR